MLPVPTTVAELLAELGGVARYGTLRAVAGRDEIEAAVGCGAVLRDGHGVYALPGVAGGRRVAVRLNGVLSHASAALEHGWAVKTVPDRPHVTVPRGRKLGARAALTHVHYADLAKDQTAHGATVPAVTLLQCLRVLPSDEALAIADSALREDGCRQLLARVADEARGRGAARVRSVAARASGLAANPFESVARDLCDRVAGLRVQPQVTIRDGAFAARADLVDTRLRIVVECDSFEWHGSRSALASDCRRYNRMVVAGWIVLRFSYEDVMFHPDEVVAVLGDAVALAGLLAKVGRKRRPAA